MDLPLLVEADIVQFAQDYTGEKFHAILCDPPYALISIAKRFGKPGSAPAHEGADGSFARLSKGFMGQQWDSFESLDQYRDWVETWAKLLIDKILHPGAVCLFFGGTRTWHHLALGLEAGGFEVYDTLLWLYGSGLPKNHKISKAIDKAAGAEGEIIEEYEGTFGINKTRFEQGYRPSLVKPGAKRKPATPEADQWEGYGTGLKPAWECLILAKAPLDREGEQNKIVENLLKLESRLWSLLPVKTAKKNFGLSQVEHKEACAFAQWNVGERSNILADLLEVTDMSSLELAISTCLNIVMSWGNCLLEILKPTKTSIIKMEIDQIIDLKTLRLCTSVITLQSIIQAEINQPGSKLDVLPAAKYLNAAVASISNIHMLSALENAISKGLILPQDVAGEDYSPDWEPILLCRAPRQGATFASLALEHGSGALNIDGGRIEGVPEATRFDPEKHSHEGWRFTDTGKDTADRAVTKPGRWPANLVMSHHEDCQLISSTRVPARVINRWKDGMKPFGGGAGGEYETVHPSRQGEASAERTYEDEGATNFAMKPGARRDKEMEIIERWACVPECPIRQLDDQAGISSTGEFVTKQELSKGFFGGIYDKESPEIGTSKQWYGGSGGPSRFFYCGKASRAEKDKGLKNWFWHRTNDGFERISEDEWRCLPRRERARGNIHPTVKPLELLRYLATLIKPPDIVKTRLLVPFSGSGSELIAAHQAGWSHVVGIEISKRYNEMAEARILGTLGMF